MSEKKLSAAQRFEARALSVELMCDPRSVEKVMQGGEVRGVLGQRIREALSKKRKR